VVGLAGRRAADLTTLIGRRGAGRGAAWHHAQVSNGATEALNNLIKGIKRVAFGFRRFAGYRIRALLYAGKPNWDLLVSGQQETLAGGQH
jgi:hypothetical protein